MIEVLDLLAEYEILQQGGSPFPSLQAELVSNRSPHIGREEHVSVIDGELVEEVLRRLGGRYISWHGSFF